MKAIMYHYVREYRSELPRFRFLDIQNFRKQLDYFDQKYGFISRKDWDLVIKKKKLDSVEGKVVLTFDDSLSCHFDYVFPELKKRNLWGIFYVPTQPYINSKMLDVHRVHLLCGAFDGPSLLNALHDFLEEDMISDSKIKNFRNKTYLKQSNYEGISEFKQTLNYFVNYQFRENLIDKIANTVGYEFNPAHFYLSKDKLKEMYSYGNIIGAHSVTHPVMSRLGHSEQKIQIKESFSFLEDLVSQNHKTYCHPYGGFHSFNEDTIDILGTEQVMYSFSIESRDITNNDLEISYQFLPRFDCNEFPFGKAS